MDARMHPSALKEAPQAPALSRTHRLVLAAAAAGAVMTLCWAALQVRAAKEELRQLQSKAAAASSAAPERTAELERRLADLESRTRRTEAEAATRAAELETVIEFLRQENIAAQQTIERLNNPAPADGDIETNAGPAAPGR
jgi:uncharacterized protein HemX